MSSWLSEGLIIATCVLVSAFFSGSETAFTRLSPFKARELAQAGGFVGYAVARIIRSPTRMLSTILIGNNIVNVAAGAVASVVAVRMFGEETGVLVATFGITLLLLVFSEVTPKGFATHFPSRVARVVAAPLFAAELLLAPAVRVLEWITHPLIRLLSGGAPPSDAISAAEVRALARRFVSQTADEAGVVEIMAMTLDAVEAKVADIMQPRGEVFHLDESRSVADAFEAFVRSRYSRAPLSREGLDEVTGFVHLKDVAVRLKTEPDRPLREIARPILRIPRTRGALELLREMQLTLTHMAVVLDEFGVTVGLVTAEDCLEEIVGEIRDEFDRGEFAAIRKAGEDAYIVFGRVRAIDFARQTGIEVTTREGATLGGILFNRLKRRVVEGDVVEIDGVRLTALEVSGLRVVRVRAERIQPPEDPIGLNLEEH
ncbi:MAG: HlyC/CorC family transporter [Myxococcales bacterium]|nr:HlyC/CorC family transporter [Myxococcales bacterium]